MSLPRRKNKGSVDPGVYSNNCGYFSEAKDFWTQRSETFFVVNPIIVCYDFPFLSPVAIPLRHGFKPKDSIPKSQSFLPSIEPVKPFRHHLPQFRHFETLGLKGRASSVTFSIVTSAFPGMSISRTFCLWSTILLLLDLSLAASSLKYLWGDAIENPSALSPADGQPYPWDLTAKMAGGQLRHARTFGDAEIPELLTPEETRQILLRSFRVQNGYEHHLRSYKEDDGLQRDNQSSRGQGRRKGRSKEGNGTMATDQPPINMQPEYEGCVPSRLCPSTYNTTAPLYGISLTSGKPVTIVQKFPDLLQQVVFQVCKSSECDVIHGECVQTFIPYLFLVLPLGPVSITGQDYILVESGCTCQPRYAKRHLTPPLPFIQPINS